MKRRDFLHAAGLGAGALLLNDSLSTARAATTKASAQSGKIDRKALVARHDIAFDKPDAMTPLSVGNGEFAFTADVTGLQTFPDFHASGMMLQTMAQWAWHETPDTHHYQLSDAFTLYDSHGRLVPYPTGGETGHGLGGDSPAGQWLNNNPHKFDLGRVALLLPKVENRPARIEDLRAISQRLDLWRGLLTSRFQLLGKTVTVETVAHPTQDILAVRITSDLVRDGSLGARLHFPYAPPSWILAGVWNHPDNHETVASTRGDEFRFARQLDGTTRSFARAALSPNAKYQQLEKHEFAWKATGQNTLTLVLGFSPEERNETLPKFDDVRKSAAQHWEIFWDERRRHRSFRQPRRALERTGTAPGFVAISDGGELRRLAAAAGNRPGAKQLGAANFTSKCTGGTARIFRYGIARIC